MHVHTGVCRHMSNDDVSFSFLKAYGKSLQLGQHPAQSSCASPEGKAMSQLSSLQKDEFTQKCPHWSFSGVFAFLQGKLAAGCVARREGLSRAAICSFWEILINSSQLLLLFLFLLFSSSFHTLTGCPVPQTRGWASAAGWWLNAECAHLCIVLVYSILYVVSGACYSVCLYNQVFLHVCVCVCEKKDVFHPEGSSLCY